MPTDYRLELPPPHSPSCSPICWNYLYLSQKFAEIDDPVKREEFLHALTHGSAASWRHVNLLGEYRFSEERLKDSIGIKPPKLID